MKLFLFSFQIKNNQLISKELNLDPIISCMKEVEDLMNDVYQYII